MPLHDLPDSLHFSFVRLFQLSYHSLHSQTLGLSPCCSLCLEFPSSACIIIPIVQMKKWRLRKFSHLSKVSDLKELLVHWETQTLIKSAH